MKANIPPVLLFLSVIIALFYLGSQMRPAATLSHFWLLVTKHSPREFIEMNQGIKYENLLPNKTLISRTAHPAGSLAK